VRESSYVGELIRIIKDTNDQKFEDEETETSQVRKVGPTFIQEDDEVENITDHKTPAKGTGKTYYRVNWSRPYTV
jgi:hypothetical protein